MIVRCAFLGRNAFIFWNPVPPELFFDRHEIVEFFSRALSNKRYDVLIAIIAPFKFGKTSILMKLHDLAKKCSDVIPVLLRLNIVDAPVTAMIDTIGSELGVDFSELLDKARKGLIKLYKVFEEVNKLLEEREKWIILFIDEFQYLPSLIKAEGFLVKHSNRYIFEFFKGVSEAFRFGLVVSGSIIGEILDAIDAWHGRFIIYRPRSFPREDSITMLNHFFKISGFEVSKDLVEYIAVSMLDHPYHMQLFGYYLVDAGSTDEEAVEKVRLKIQNLLVDYYEKKIIEAKKIVPNALDYFLRILNGLETRDVSYEDLEDLSKLERMGYIYQENGRYEFFDPMFKKYITNILSGRPKERYIPEYTSEYIIAKDLAYKEGFKEIFIALMSWGPFDILIKRKVGNYNGIGIQVKRTYQEDKKPAKQTIKELEKAAKELNILPVIATIEMPTKRITYAIPTKPQITSNKLTKILEKLT